MAQDQGQGSGAGPEPQVPCTRRAYPPTHQKIRPLVVFFRNMPRQRYAVLRVDAAAATSRLTSAVWASAKRAASGQREPYVSTSMAYITAVTPSGEMGGDADSELVLGRKEKRKEGKAPAEAWPALS